MNEFRQYDGYTQTRGLAAHMIKVYAWMFLGLMVSAVSAIIAVSTPLGYLVYNPISLIILVLAEVGMVWFLSARVINMNYSTAAGVFVTYSAINGLTLSLIFYMYTLGSIFYVFFITALFFGAMSVYGAVTKQDLTSIGSFLAMGLIGVLLASIVNIFLASSTLYWIISYAGVAVFLGLTAYDVQKIKRYYGTLAGTPRENNVAILGALQLYLDFINLFLFILRILGRRR
ncbi:MAG TPA: Bax inhibitor-1/YccA family protein [Pseudobacteroides sp.]|uniref:Bax inhibitor-1/YccA family protein n=1 Tax=Pseudobacteroides sp. TaxID=1968840 RepID=UPI002F92AF9E